MSTEHSGSDVSSMYVLDTSSLEIQTPLVVTVWIYVRAFTYGVPYRYALRRADPPSKDPYQMSEKHKFRKLL
jgi:hypothetical protein